MSILQSRRRADLAAVAVSGIASAWTPFTPTVSSGSGTITTVGGKSASALKVGRLVFYRASIAITTNGSGAADVRITNMPYTCAAANYFGTGREAAITGKMLLALMASGTTILVIINYDNTYPASNGCILELSGVYEAAS